MAELGENTMMSNVFEEQDRVGLPRIVLVEEDSDTSASSPPSRSSSSDNWKILLKKDGTPNEYWHIQKLIKYMKAGNQTATMVELSCLKNYDLTTEISQRAITDVGGLEVLVNLLDTKDLCCILGTLAVLKEVTVNKETRHTLINMGATTAVVELLSDRADDVRTLAAETITQIAKNLKGRKLCRRKGCIPNLIALLDIPERLLMTPTQDLTEKEKLSLGMMRAGCNALWSMSSSQRSREEMRKCGLVHLIARALKTIHLDVAIPAMGLLQMCLEESSFRLAVLTEKIMGDVIVHLVNRDKELERYCCLAICKCACDSKAITWIRQSGGLELLIDVASDSTNKTNKHLMAAVTGALSKCADSDESIKKLTDLGAVPILINLLDDEHPYVLANVCGALAECAKHPQNCEKIKAVGGIPLLVNFLNQSHKPLLENVSMVLMECAKSQNCMEQIEELDGIRLIWSLLKNESNRVKVKAAWALCPCIQNATDSGEIVRSFVGALELTVKLLDSNDIKVLTSVCAVIALIAQNDANLAIMTELSLVEKLSTLVLTEDDHLRANLALAIAYCCVYEDNCQEFGRRRAVAPLVRYLLSKNTDVQRSTALALYHLSIRAVNCVAMHAAGCVKLLLPLMDSKDATTQEAAAGSLANIRKLALAMEMVKMGEHKEKGKRIERKR